MAIAIHPNTHTINLLVDSESAINLAVKVANESHTNLHEFPNRVSLRAFLEITKGRKIYKVNTPLSTSSPAINLIHIYSHSDEDEKRKKANHDKFGHSAQQFIELNNTADWAAKNNSDVPNHGHHPLNPHNDNIIIYSPIAPSQHYSLTLRSLSNNKLADQFKKVDKLKASRWFNPEVDLVATSSPLQCGDRKLECFVLKLLYAGLPTRPTVRRSGWFKNLPTESTKRATYDSDNCPSCGKYESHQHIFEECGESEKFKTKFKEDALGTVNQLTGMRFNDLPWWFKGGEWKGDEEATLVAFREDLGWRGYVPNVLFNYLMSKVGSSLADTLVKKLANMFAECNLNIWTQRCKKLYPKRYNSQTQPPLSTPSPSSYNPSPSNN